MTTESDDPSGIAFDKMMTAAFETCDALTDFYCHFEDVRRNALAGISTPDTEASKLVGVVYDAHDRYFAAACEFGDLSEPCAECQAAEVAKAPATQPPAPSAVQPPAPVAQPPKPAGRALH